MGCGVKNSPPLEKKILVMHRNFIIEGSCPCWAASWTFPDNGALSSIFQSQENLDCWNSMTAWQSAFTAIIWAGTECWSPCVRDWQDWAGRTRRGTAYMVVLQGNVGGKKKLRFMRPLESISSREFSLSSSSVRALTQMCLKFLFFYFFFTLSRTTTGCILSGEAKQPTESCAEQEKMFCLCYFLFC